LAYAIGDLCISIYPLIPTFSPEGRRGFLLSSREERIEVRRDLNLNPLM